MASSSVSQEDFENDYELTSRRSKIRTARARINPSRSGDPSSITLQSKNYCTNRYLIEYKLFIYNISMKN